MAVFGLDLGATKLAAALFDHDGNILERDTALLTGRDGDDVGRLIAKRGTALHSLAATRGMEVEAVGVSVPGIAHHAGGTV
jgi:predicted NBD/HSP70 family sugar kinase